MTYFIFSIHSISLQHAVICSSGVGCFLSLNTSLIVIVCSRRAALWGSVYLDAHGEEDRNLRLFSLLCFIFFHFFLKYVRIFHFFFFRRGKPLFLSERRFEKLNTDWTMQSFEHLVLNFFNFDDLMFYLRDGHYIYYQKTQVHCDFYTPSIISHLVGKTEVISYVIKMNDTSRYIQILLLNIFYTPKSRVDYLAFLRLLKLRNKDQPPL